MSTHRNILGRTFSLTGLGIIALLTACGGGEAGRSATPDATSNGDPEATIATDAHDSTHSELPQVVVTDDAPFTIKAALPGSGFNNAVLGLQVRPDQDKMTARFDFNVGGFQLKDQTPDAMERGCANSPDGQHIHFILNNKPDLAKYEASFEEALDPGHNVLLAFLSRSYHESVKDAGAFVVTQINMKGDGGVPAFDVYSDPTLFYSRPKGDYTGADGKKVLLDFFLVNTVLSEDGYRVRATIDGHPVVLTHWVPYFIEGLELGEHTIRLELLDSNGAPVPGPFNDSGERTFRVLEG